MTVGDRVGGETEPAVGPAGEIAGAIVVVDGDMLGRKVGVPVVATGEMVGVVLGLEVGDSVGGETEPAVGPAGDTSPAEGEGVPPLPFPGDFGVFGALDSLGALGALGCFGALGSLGAFGALGSFGALGALGSFVNFAIPLPDMPDFGILLCDLWFFFRFRETLCSPHSPYSVSSITVE